MEDKGEKKDKPPILKYLRSLFVHAIEMIDNDQCSEADAMSMISRFNAESKGFYDKTSLLNYDEAMEKAGNQKQKQVQGHLPAPLHRASQAEQHERRLQEDGNRRLGLPAEKRKRDRLSPVFH